MTILTGWLVALYVAIAAFSGAGLTWHYAPDPASAHGSVAAFEAASPFLGFVRAAHHHASHGAIALAVLHVAAVLYARREKFEEPSRWLSGVLLLAAMIVVAFSGRVLPWDQHAGVSLTVAQAFLRAGSHDWLGPLLGESLRLQRLLWLHVGVSCAIVWLGVSHGASASGFRRWLDQGAGRWRWLGGAALVLGAWAMAARAQLGPSFDPAAAEAVTAEWYLRWSEALSLRSAAAARAVAVVLCVAACTTPWWARRIGASKARAFWWGVIASLGLLSLIPLR